MISNEEAIEFLTENNLSHARDGIVGVECRLELLTGDNLPETKFSGIQDLKEIQDYAIEFLKRPDVGSVGAPKVVYEYWFLKVQDNADDHVIEQFSHSMDCQHFVEATPEELREEIKSSIFQSILERYSQD